MSLSIEARVHCEYHFVHVGVCVHMSVSVTVNEAYCIVTLCESIHTQCYDLICLVCLKRKAERERDR